MAAEEAPATVDARARMVEQQLRARGIVDERVLGAMGRVPRERFVRDRESDLAYTDAALPLDAGQSISQPYIVARMTELLEAAPGQRVLEIGTGSGYQAAVLAEMGCRVTSIERIDKLAIRARATLAALGYGSAIDVRLADGTPRRPRRGSVAADHRDGRGTVCPRGPARPARPG